MIFTIQTLGEVSGLEIVEALSRAGISHVILSKQNDNVAQQSEKPPCTCWKDEDNVAHIDPACRFHRRAEDAIYCVGCGDELIPLCPECSGEE